MCWEGGYTFVRVNVLFCLLWLTWWCLWFCAVVFLSVIGFCGDWQSIIKNWFFFGRLALFSIAHTRCQLG